MRWLATDHVTIAEDADRHFGFPGAAMLKNGDIVVVFREGKTHGNDVSGRICLSRSKDGGRTWLPRVKVFDRPDFDDRDPSIIQTSKGPVLLLSNNCLCISEDFGKTWSEPLPTPVFGPKGLVEDETGHLLYGGQEHIQKWLTKLCGREVRLNALSAYRSGDMGLSWKRVGIATYTAWCGKPIDYVWYDEPFMCVVPDKFWIFTARVDLDGFARIIRSADKGKQWGPVIKTQVWGYPQHLLPLKDGRLLMTYGYRRPPYGVRACLSSDCGETWDLDNEIIIRMDGGTPKGKTSEVSNDDLGYPVSLQLKDGTIFTVYYFNINGSNCFISGTRWQLPK